MAPIDEAHTGLDLMARLGYPVILVTGSYLGALSHTLTALAALRGRGDRRQGNRRLRIGAERGTRRHGRQPRSICRSRPFRVCSAETHRKRRREMAHRATLTALCTGRSFEIVAMTSWIRHDSCSPTGMNKVFPHVWLPYCQMQVAPPPLPVVRTHGCRIVLADGRELIDGIASWWSVCHGYNHPHILECVARQLETMPHVMFGGLVHEPALRLASRLTALVPRGA